MNKADYRKAYRELSRNLSSEERAERSLSLLTQLRPMLLNSPAQGIAVFMPLKDEADITPLYHELWEAGKKLYLPKVLSAKEMDFFAFESFDELIPSEPYGILEPKGEASKKIKPQDLELMLVSGLAFDKKGYRLGRGKAYYDRYLVQCPQIETIGLSLSLLEIEELPSNEWDIPMKQVLKTT